VKPSSACNVGGKEAMHLRNIQSIHDQYDHVYVSPHLDDVAASCSGRIFKQRQQGESVLVVTVFTRAVRSGSKTVSQALKSVLNYPCRREEDRMAMQRMGVDYLWLEHPEILFRNQKPWTRYWPQYQDSQGNKTLCDTLIREFQDICRRTRCTDVILPLGVGQHMDHQMIFQAGVALLHDQDHPFRIVFYEETPYALFPFLLIYRLKKTGIADPSFYRQYQQTGDSGHLSAKAAFRFWSAIPSLGIQGALIKPWAFLLIVGFDLYTRHWMKPSAGFSESHNPLPEICDITPFIDKKLFVISAYTSQLAGPMVAPQGIKGGLSAYAKTLGMPRGNYGERYWITPRPDMP
jgi:LmbE family N-acetylglucosaminyl deacetylase